MSCPCIRPLAMLLAGVAIVGCAQGPHGPTVASCCAGTAPRTTAATQASTGKYTCPVHPEVTSDTPGTCPKCGMALVSKP